MNVTNRKNLPLAIVQAVTNDPYDRGTAWRTGTELVGPPRLALLRRLHEADLEEDAADRIWSLLGQAVHSILERAAIDALAEKRLSCVIDGKEIGAGLDHYSLIDDVLTDWKVSSAWAVVRGVKEEWTGQLNVLAYLLRRHGRPVSRTQIGLICRDWRPSEALRSQDYPRQAVELMPVDLWSMDSAEAYLRERVALHRAAEDADAAGTPLPHCSDAERWKRPAVWAVKREGGKMAVRGGLHPTKDAAEAFIVAQIEQAAEAGKKRKPGAPFVIEHRPGGAIRCASYCPVRTQCLARNDGQFQPGDIPEPDATDEGAESAPTAAA